MPESPSVSDRDHQLAILRTKLSNTRTLLSHIKASIGLLISALGFIKFFNSYLFFDACGWTLLVLALFVFIRGIILYRQTKEILDDAGA